MSLGAEGGKGLNWHRERFEWPVNCSRSSQAVESTPALTFAWPLLLSKQLLFSGTQKDSVMNWLTDIRNTQTKSQPAAHLSLQIYDSWVLPLESPVKGSLLTGAVFIFYLCWPFKMTWHSRTVSSHSYEWCFQQSDTTYTYKNVFKAFQLLFFFFWRLSLKLLKCQISKA